MSILGNKKTNHKGWFFQDFLVHERVKEFLYLIDLNVIL